MARELHHRKKDDKYALWSTLLDDYVIEWTDKETIRQIWYKEKIEEATKQVDAWMEVIDREI